MATMAAPEVTGEVKELQLSAVVPSKHNPRKLFVDDAMQELAVSITLHGVTSPILVRPEGNKYEIVYGERRYRASKLADKTTIPAIVKEMTDKEAGELRFIENLQREDLSAMEEAKELHRKYKDVPPAEIAARIGKAEAYVVLRLRLLKIIPEAQKALAEGHILLGHALELCKLRGEEQKQALQWLLGARADVGSSREWKQVNSYYSVEALKSYVQNHFMLRLAKAPFDTTDPKLNPKMGACTTCMFNTANLGALFGNLGKDGRCTVPTCYGIKTKATVENRVQEIVAEGKKVYRLGIGYQGSTASAGANVDGFYSEYGRSDVVILEPGKECEAAQPAVVTFTDENKIKLGQELTVCADSNCKKHSGSATGRTASAPRKGLAFVTHKAELLEKSLGQRVRNEAYRQLVEQLLEKADNRKGKYPRSTEAIVDYAIRHLYGDRFRDAAKAIGIERPEKKSSYQGPDWEGVYIKHFGSNKAALLLATIAAEYISDSDKKSVFYQMAAEFKVNVDKIRKEYVLSDRAEVKAMKERAIDRAHLEKAKAKEAAEEEPKKLQKAS